MSWCCCPSSYRVSPLIVLLAFASIASADRESQPTTREAPRAETPSRLIRDRAVQAELELSEQQTRAIDAAFKEVNRALLATRDEPRQTAREKTARAMKLLDGVLKKTLSAEQKSKWKALFGKPFDFSHVRPVGIEAPEFEEASAWINSAPLTMAALRGQVVVVHFYTFSCGNCIANFPWYKSWQETFGGKGVTIVGIHTPETEGERDIEAVRRKAQKAGCAFPILVDNNKSNWAAWSNNVWPAVYLVDKEGRVRSWWYGELNWKGAAGEQRMRERINRLLKEESPYPAKSATTQKSPATQPITRASSPAVLSSP